MTEASAEAIGSEGPLVQTVFPPDEFSDPSQEPIPLGRVDA